MYHDVRRVCELADKTQAHLEWIKHECSDIPLPCAFEFVHCFGACDTGDDNEPFLLKGEDKGKRHWIVTP
jgi:hypothetical protein